MYWYVAFKETEDSVAMLQVIDIDKRNQELTVSTTDEAFAKRQGFMSKAGRYINWIDLKEVGSVYHSDDQVNLIKSTRPKMLAEFISPDTTEEVSTDEPFN